MQRRFLLKASTAHTAADFDLRQVASTSGRLDVVCRCALAALTGPRGIRRDVEFSAVLEGPPHPPFVLTISGAMLSELPGGEEMVAGSIFNAFESGSLSNGLAVKRESFEKAVRELLASKSLLFYLHEEGQDIEVLKDSRIDEIGFILGDQVGFDAQSERFLDSMHIPGIAVGPRSYLSSNCIIFVNTFLDALEG